ncbi:MAG: hypothetical protein WC371_00835 [Parachlamydiales bacterium]|jgi:hypothetical protein
MTQPITSGPSQVPNTPDSPRGVLSLCRLAALAVSANPALAIENFKKKHTISEHYFALCEHFSSRMLSETKNLLLEQLPQLSRQSFCILTTGSDGRSEKLNRSESPVELVVYYPEGETEETLCRSISALAKSNLSLFSQIDVKKASEHALCVTMQKIIPTRPLHSKILVGDETTFTNYLINFIKELKSMSAKDFKKFKKDFCEDSLRKLKKTSLGGASEDVDLDKGLIQYDGSYKKRATKYNLLRAIQYNLDKVICNFIREADEETSLDFLKHMPHNTFELIDYLSQKHLLDKFSSAEIAFLKEAYKTALIYFHVAQLLFTHLEKPVSLQLNARQTEELKATFQKTAELISRL